MENFLRVDISKASHLFISWRWCGIGRGRGWDRPHIGNEMGWREGEKKEGRNCNIIIMFMITRNHII